MQKKIIQTERLILRPWRMEDLEPLARLYAGPRVMEYWEVKTFKEARKDYNHFVSSLEKHGYGFWAVELNDSHQFIILGAVVQ